MRLFRVVGVPSRGGRAVEGRMNVMCAGGWWGERRWGSSEVK